MSPEQAPAPEPPNHWLPVPGRCAVAVAVALGEGFMGVANAASGVAFGSVLGGEAQAVAVSRIPVRVVAARSRAARVFKLSPN